MFLSVSIDLVGSTAMKRSISQDRGGDFRAINAIYERYAEIMFKVEEELYHHLAAREEVDIRRLFLVKIIGDEYWFLYELEDEDEESLVAVATAVMAGMLKVFGHHREFAFRDLRDDSRCFDVSFKALVDLLTNALHLPQRRYAFFADKIDSLLRSEDAAPNPTDADREALCHGLNLRPRSDVSARDNTRSDYVGTQVDRFFRTAAACKPRLVTVGEALWSRLRLKTPSIAAGVEVHGVAPEDENMLPAGCRAVHEVIPASEMTGIDTDYTVWHLFTEDTLREDIYRPYAETIDYLDDTRAFLARSGFYGLDRG